MRSVPILVGIVLCATAFAGPRAGKVVRVERRPSGIVGAPRFCSVSTSDNIAYCSAMLKGPEVGQRITVLDYSRVLGTIRIEQVQGTSDGCHQTVSWMAQGHLERGDLSRATGSVVGVLDVHLDPRHARLINVDRSPTGHPWGYDTVIAIDNNNDGAPDLEFVQFNCDDSGGYTGAATSTCTEVWGSQPPRGMVRLRAERVQACY